MYRKLFKIFNKFLEPHIIFKYAFNLAPMYRRTTGKIVEVSKDLHFIKVVIPLNFKNRNYIGTIFGGSMLSATDPIYMIQLIQILGDDYVVWDKKATIRYKIPARSKIYAEFIFTTDEISNILQKVEEFNEYDVVKNLNIMNNEGKVIAELEKTIYVANKQFYKQKQERRNLNKS